MLLRFVGNFPCDMAKSSLCMSLTHRKDKYFSQLHMLSVPLPPSDPSKYLRPPIFSSSFTEYLSPNKCQIQTPKYFPSLICHPGMSIWGT